jgi:ribose transport system substrate-binding protein
VSCETVKKFVKGEKIPAWVKVEDKFYDKSNAQANMADGY